VIEWHSDMALGGDNGRMPQAVTRGGDTISSNDQVAISPLGNVQTRHPGLALALLAFALALVSTACTDSGPGTQPTNTSSSRTPPAKPAPPDQNLRDVTKAMIYSDGIAYVLPETAAQLLCGALSPAEWRQIIGTDVGRTVYGGAGAKCVVSTGALVIDLQTTVEALGGEGERIAGRRVKVDDSSSSKRVAAASAAVVALGELDIPAQQRVGAEPVLHLVARMTDVDRDAPDLPALLHQLLAVLLPRLIPTGPATPVYDAAGKLAYTPTEPVAGLPIYDLPRTVQSLVLCTVVLRETRIKAQSASILVNSVGECNISTLHIFAAVTQFLPPVAESSPYKIAGRPAEEIPDIGIVINLLSIPTEYERTEHLTLRLNNYAPAAQLRGWAEKVAQQILSA
jgi:hypothetical protein